MGHPSGAVERRIAGHGGRLRAGVRGVVGLGRLAGVDGVIGLDGTCGDDRGVHRESIGAVGRIVEARTRPGAESAGSR